MCGIVGYVGKKEVVAILLDGLKRLEYRGYDSAGIALQEKDKISVAKKKGKLELLDSFINKSHFSGLAGIGHTRWATHGEPTAKNAHPHTDCKKEIAVVHNGIIENYQKLKEQLEKEGHKFRSKTDSEVIAHLIEKYYSGNLEKAVRRTVKRLEGSYAIGVISKNEPNKIVAARCDSPLIIGLGKDENFIASDVPAILTHSKRIIYLNNYEIATLTNKSVKVQGINGKVKRKKSHRITWGISAAEKGGYPHFMLKEIEEQPDVVKNIIKTRLKGKNKINFSEANLSKKELNKIEKISIIACGTARHAGMIGKYLIEKYSRIPVEVDLSSEYKYRDPTVKKNELVIVISQSGETADTLAALRLAKKKKANILAICNVVGSSIARESTHVIYTHAGPEIGVASTKAYIAQLSILYLFSLYLASAKGLLTKRKKKKYLDEFKKIPYSLCRILKNKDKIKKCAEKYKDANNFLHLGRNLNYPTALEGALKLKEISYIHAEGCAAGEMKHGPIALIDKTVPSVCIAPKTATYEKMLSNIQELKARRGIVISIASEKDKEIKKHSDYILYVPRIQEDLYPILIAVSLQLLAYYIAVERGCDVDKPRNLAKSVTVE
jgi:glucosamine--fructose-6-phosphate aminotransferase (isomerizing)